MDQFDSSFSSPENHNTCAAVFHDVAERLLVSPLTTIEDVDYADEQDKTKAQPHSFKLGLSRESIGAGLAQRGLEEMPLEGYLEYVEPFTMDQGETLELACLVLNIRTSPFDQPEDGEPILLSRMVVIEETGDGYVYEDYTRGMTQTIGNYTGVIEEDIKTAILNRRPLRNEDVLLLMEVAEQVLD